MNILIIHTDILKIIIQFLSSRSVIRETCTFLNELEFNTTGRRQKYTFSVLRNMLVEPDVMREKDKRIPRIVTHLTLYSIPKELPPQLEYLNISGLDNVRLLEGIQFPKTLKKLRVIPLGFSFIVSQDFFPQITDLTLEVAHNKMCLSDSRFDNITALKIGNNITGYPRNLYSLIFIYQLRTDLLKKAIIPNSIKELTIPHFYWPTLIMTTGLKLQKLVISELYWIHSARNQFCEMSIPFPIEIIYSCNDSCKTCKNIQYNLVDNNEFKIYSFVIEDDDYR